MLRHGGRAADAGYQRVRGSKVWLKYQAGWVRPEQLPAPLVPGQPPLSRCSAQKDSSASPWLRA